MTYSGSVAGILNRGMETVQCEGKRKGCADSGLSNARYILFLMKTHTAVAALAFIAGVVTLPEPAAAQKAGDWTSVEAALGRKGALQPGDVMKFSFPRSDLTVIARGVQLKPALALGSWIAFKRVANKNTMAMGDLVLLEDEVEPVMQALQKGGVEQTALHNHVLGEIPRIMFMHISAHGDGAGIAGAIHDALSLTKTPLAPPAPPATVTIDLDTAAVARELGYSGKVNGGVYQVAIPRAEKVYDNRMEIPSSMGIATAINFQPTGAGKAAITGDFVMIGREVNPVLRALRSHGIDVTAIHSHMLSETPRLFFMHFWANDDPVTLAKGLHAALAEMHVQPPLAKRN